MADTLIATVAQIMVADIAALYALRKPERTSGDDVKLPKSSATAPMTA